MFWVLFLLILFKFFFQFRKELEGSVKLCELWILTGLPKIPLTNFMKLFFLIQLIMQSAMIPRSTGYVMQSTNIVNWEVWLQLVRNQGDWAKVISTPKLLVDHVVPAGNEEIHCNCEESDNELFIFLEIKIFWYVILSMHILIINKIVGNFLFP